MTQENNLEAAANDPAYLKKTLADCLSTLQAISNLTDSNAWAAIVLARLQLKILVRDLKEYDDTTTDTSPGASDGMR